MFTLQDFEEARIKKMFNDINKNIVRNMYPPERAEEICNKIDREERAEHFQKAYNEFAKMLTQYGNQQIQYIQYLAQNGLI